MKSKFHEVICAEGMSKKMSQTKKIRICGIFIGLCCTLILLLLPVRYEARWILVSILNFCTGAFLYFLLPDDKHIAVIRTSRRCSNKSYLTDAQIFKRRKRLGIALMLMSTLVIAGNGILILT